MEQINIFDNKFSDLIYGKISTVFLEGANDSEVSEVEKDIIIEPSRNGSMCSYCKVQFENFQQQREHYKLDWHRYNLKQDLLGRDAITEEQFSEKTDDLSSISGSDSEKEDTLDMIAKAQGKIFLKSSQGKVMSLFRCLLADRKVDIDDGTLNGQFKKILTGKWTVLMMGGGHFAGAVFRGMEPIVHKTFHSYTVRAGQGGSQSSRDNRNATSQARGAGASLRRYNETTFVQHINDIIAVWKDEIASSNLIIYRAAGPFNRSILFGGKNPLLDRNDSRLRSVPCSTRRATFTEVKRVHALLTTISVYESLESATLQFAKDKSLDGKRTKAKAPEINRAKSRERTRPLPEIPHGTETSDSESEEEHQLEFVEQDRSFDESLRPFGDTLTPEQRKFHKKKKAPRKSKAKKEREEECRRKQELFEVISTGNLEVLSNVFKTNDSESAVNEVLDTEGNSLLHLAALNEQVEVLAFLLERNANICARNLKQYTPYSCTQSVKVRDFLKGYAKDNPEKWNYNKAQIPLPAPNLTAEELAEKKRNQKKAKREKEKQKKIEKDIERKELEAQERFKKLSDREKRALAAERRILNQSGVVISRCFLCGSDMAGKVPFEYLGNRFCTIECLKAHRMKNAVVLS